MTKLEDKLTASIKKPVPKKKIEPIGQKKDTKPVKPKKAAGVSVKQRKVKQQKTSSGTAQSACHHQRVWPD